MNPQNPQNPQNSQWWQRAEWWQIVLTVIGLLIIAPLGWLCLQVYDMKPTVLTTASRVDRIANALPEMSRYIAEEEIRRKPRGIIITETPRKTKDEDSIIRVHLIDPDKKQFLYTITTKDPEDVEAKIAGLVEISDSNSPSFNRLKKWSNEVGSYPKIEGNINLKTSFFLRDSDASYYSMELWNLAGNSKEYNKPIIRSDNWQEMTEELDKLNGIK
jgi:hypothetical protein